MSQMLLNMEFMKTLAWSLIAPRHAEYSEDIFRDLSQMYPHLITTHPKITNANHQKLKCTIMASVHDGPCYIYLHALGSNRTEGLLALKHLPKQASLAIFDFSGSGKSEGEYISYGNKQKEDLESVLQFLRKFYNFKNYIIWGRSMGAVTALMHNKTYNPVDVSVMILDSPFHSFEEASKDIIRQRVPSLPEFLINSLVGILRFSCRKIEYSPFDIDFSDISINTPAVFVYSESDTIINCEQVLKLVRNYRGIHDSICIKQDHNQIRGWDCYIQAISKSQSLTSKRNRLKASSVFRKSRGIQLTAQIGGALKDITLRINTDRGNINRSKARLSDRGYYA